MENTGTSSGKREGEEKKKTAKNGAEGHAEGHPDASTKGADGKGGWDEVQLERPLYKPESCKDTPIIGYVLDLIHMPENDNGPWSCFVIRLTKPCLAVNGFDSDAVPQEFPEGTEILLNLTVKLRTVDRFLHPKWLIEVRVQPTKKEKLSGGRTMWLYSVAANRETVQKRPATMQITAHHPVAQIAARAETRPEDDIPF